MFTAVSGRGRGSFACILLKKTSTISAKSSAHVPRVPSACTSSPRAGAWGRNGPVRLNCASCIRARPRRGVGWLITRFAPPILLLRHEKHDEGAASKTGAEKALGIHPYYSSIRGRPVTVWARGHDGDISSGGTQANHHQQTNPSASISTTLAPVLASPPPLALGCCC